MAFSVEALAQAIVDGHDTTSAAILLGQPVTFIQRVQQTSSYREALEEAQRVAGLKESSADSPTVINARQGQLYREIKFYTSGVPPATEFVMEFYEGIDNYIDRNQMSDPPEVSYDPETPETAPGTHEVVVSYIMPARRTSLYTLFFVR